MPLDFSKALDEGDDRNTSGWMRATSSGGSAAFEGRVHWSGELGYGVRPPEKGQTDEEATAEYQVREVEADDVPTSHGGHVH